MGRTVFTSNGTQQRVWITIYKKGDKEDYGWLDPEDEGEDERAWQSGDYHKGDDLRIRAEVKDKQGRNIADESVYTTMGSSVKAVVVRKKGEYKVKLVK